MLSNALSAAPDRVSRGSKSEFSCRLEHFRSIMAANEIEVSVLTTPESVYYLSGYYTRAITSVTALIVTSGEHTILITRQVDEGNYMRIQAQSPITRFVAFTDDQMDASADLIAVTAREHLSSGCVGVEPGGLFVSPAEFSKLTLAMGDTPIADVGKIISGQRQVKSPWELACHREAGRMTVAAMSRTIDAVKTGATDADVAAVAAESIIASGSEWMATWPIVLTGNETGRSHSSWQGDTIAPGAPTTLEFSSVRHRYHSPAYRTVIHSPSPEQVSLANAVGEGHQAILGALKAGQSAESVFHAKQRVFDNTPWSSLSRARAGYMVGISFAPNWVQRNSVDLMDGNKTELLPGMVFHAITAVIAVNKFCVAHSSTVVITDTGFEDLTADGFDMPILIG